MAAVSTELSVSPDVFPSGRREASNLLRDLAVHIASRIAEFPHAAIKPRHTLPAACPKFARRLAVNTTRWWGESSPIALRGVLIQDLTPIHVVGPRFASVESLVEAMDAVFEATASFVDRLDVRDLPRMHETPWGPETLHHSLWYAREHAVHHRAQLFLRMRMLGRTPPDL